ncbi:MAG: GNAT family N-acetyltransferase [Burkholderiaceae bacterium]|jgi:GNAT superfamily N-acetyltransferase
MPLEYRLLSKREALALDPRQYNANAAEYANLRLKQVRRLDDGDVVAVVAFDGPRIVGKLLIRYGLLPFDDASIRLACAQDLLVAAEYRGQGIGRAILERSTAIGVPQIHSGLSAMSAPMIERLGFPSIDRTQAYQATLSAKGLLRRLRTDLDTAEVGSMPSRIGASGRLLAAQIGRSGRLRQNRSRVRTLDAERAVAKLDAVLEWRERRFQVPWNRGKLVHALRGQHAGMLAWVVFDGDEAAAQHRLATAYHYPREIRAPYTNRTMALSEWRVNEVYPPVRDAGAARRIVAAVVGRLAQHGADVAEVFAATPEMAQGCRDLELESSICKSMYLVPSGVDADLGRSLTTPDQWWCRALNEVQYEESQPHMDTIVAPLCCPEPRP